MTEDKNIRIEDVMKDLLDWDISRTKTMKMLSNMRAEKKIGRDKFGSDRPTGGKI